MTQPLDFGFGEEQAMLQEAARRFCKDKQPLTSLRQASECLSQVRQIQPYNL